MAEEQWTPVPLAQAAEQWQPVKVEPEPEDIFAAFDAGARLDLNPPAIEAPTETDPNAPKRRGRKPGSRNVGGRAAGAEMLGNLAITGMILLVSFTLGDWAAPTEGEGKAIAVPLGNILARRIDLAAKLGKDADDTVALVIAFASWMARIGPEGVTRARDAYRERQAHRPTVDGPPEPLRSTNGASAGGVALGYNDATGASNGTAHPEINALAKARERAYLGVDINPATPA